MVQSAWYTVGVIKFPYRLKKNVTVFTEFIYSASNLQGPLFQFFTNAFVFFCRMGTVGDVKLKVFIHVDKSFLIVCV